jgi:hypothetical protein
MKLVKAVVEVSFPLGNGSARSVMKPFGSRSYWKIQNRHAFVLLR